jgi:hypothetical protein
MVAALVTFLSLIAACLVFAHLFASLGRRGYAAYAAGTAVRYVAAFVAFFSSGTGQGWPVVTLSAAGSSAGHGSPSPRHGGGADAPQNRSAADACGCFARHQAHAAEPAPSSKPPSALNITKSGWSIRKA